MACFHCQQAVEKFLKAYLIYKKADFPRIHQLDLLRTLCIQQEQRFTEFEVGDFENYAVRNRYPHDSLLPTLQETKDLYLLACNIKFFVESLIG